MQNPKYFGNLINGIKQVYSLEEFKASAVKQKFHVSKGYALYIINEWYAMASINSKGEVINYTLLDRIDEAKEIYTESRSLDRLLNQFAWQGVSILEGIGIDYESLK